MNRGRLMNPIYIFYMLFFLGFFNFIGRGTYFIIFAGLYFIIVCKPCRLKFDIALSTVVLWAIGYTCWVFFTYGPLSVRNLLTPLAAVLCCIVGQNILRTDTMYEDFRKYYLLIALPAAFHGLINMSLNVTAYGWDFGGIRTLKDLWKSEDTLATGQATYFLLLTAVVYYSFSFNRKNRKLNNAIIILIMMLGIVYNILAASRFILYVTVIILAVSVVLHSLRTGNNHKFRPLLIAGLICLFLFIVYDMNIFGVKSWLQSSPLILRIGRLQELGTDTAFSSNLRTKQIHDVMSNLSLYIWGGNPTGLLFVHNTWLSVLNTSGIIVAIPFLLVTLFALLLGLKQVFVCRIDYAVVILGFLIGTYTYFYFEPMFEGAKWLFYAFCFIFGMMSQIDRYQSIQKKLATVGR